jgi:hypothetical protein
MNGPQRSDLPTSTTATRPNVAPAPTGPATARNRAAVTAITVSAPRTATSTYPALRADDDGAWPFTTAATTRTAAADNQPVTSRILRVYPGLYVHQSPVDTKQQRPKGLFSIQ